MVAAPLFHTWGFAGLQLTLLLGGTMVLRRRFDPTDVLRAVAEHQCTTLVAVPVMLQRILELPEAERERFDTSALRIVAASGSALPAGLATAFMDRFGDVLYNLYGSTEVSWASIANPEELRLAPDSAGRAPMGTRLRILGGDGRPVSDGEVGRVFVGNEMLFEGYTGTGKDAEVVDGMLATGDLGWFDGHGLLHVSGRTDDMIVSGGENVHPGEVEALLEALPEVREVAVVGVPDADFGQRLAAYVVLKPGGELSAEDVREHVRGRLAHFSVPRDVVFLPELPRNPTGKVLKRALAAPA